MSYSNCGYSFEVTLYKDRDNAVTVVPYSNLSELVNYDMTDVTNVEAYADLTTSTTVGDGYSANYLDDPLKVYWDNNNPDAQWRIYCKVGLFSNIVAGEYTLRITIYDPDHPNGLVLPDSDSALIVTIVDLP